MEKGVLPNEGGWLNQTQKFVDAMNIITQVVSEKNKERYHGK
jgi:hypothetical protein